MQIEKVTVFGGTGFLGRRIVERLAQRGLQVTVVSRVPAPAAQQKQLENVSLVQGDLRDATTVAAAISGAGGVVNAVGHYVEKGSATFEAIHVEGAGALAAACRKQGVERLVHLSGIGADAAARSAYVRARGRGDAAVRAAFSEAAILQPSVMFGKDDAFLNTLLSLVRRAPAIPLFGRGQTLLQPVFVEDVAEAVARLLTREAPPAVHYTLGGPQVYSYRQILELIMKFSGYRRLLVPVPFAAWDALALAAGILPSPPLSEGQVALMKRDNIAPPHLPGLRDLEIVPRSITEILARDFAPPAQ